MISVDKITMAVDKLDEMVAFYASVFDMSFTPLDLYNSKLYSGQIGEMELLLCPKSIAGVYANVNTIQLRFVVEDVKRAFDKGLMKGGMELSAVQEQDGSFLAALRDPDGNSLELVEK